MVSFKQNLKIKGDSSDSDKYYIIKEEHRLQGLAVRQNRARDRIEKVLPLIKDLKDNGFTTLREIADEMNRRGISTARGGKWYPSSVYIVVKGKIFVPRKASIIKNEYRLMGLVARKKNASDRNARVLPVIKDLKENGFVTLQAIADEMNRRGISTARGGKWYPSSVSNVIRSKKI